MGQDWPMASYPYFLDKGFFDTLKSNLLTNNLCIFPFTLVFVLIGVLGVEFLNVQISNVRRGIGDTPGNELVMPNHDTRGTRKTHADSINISRNQMTFIPDRRGSLSQVWVITKDGQTGGGHGSINYPVVACSHQTKA